MCSSSPQTEGNAEKESNAGHGGRPESSLEVSAVGAVKEAGEPVLQFHQPLLLYTPTRPDDDNGGG